MRADEFSGLLAEPDRVRVFSALVLGASDLASVVRVSGVDVKAAGKALRRLRDGGLVDGFTVDLGAIKAAARERPSPADEGHGYDDPAVESVVRTFVKGHVIVGFPASPAKRSLVLQHVAQSFEPGRRYAEKEVDVVLRAWCGDGPADHVTLRRYLVDDGLLARDGAAYWRSGGWVDVLTGPRPSTSDNAGPERENR